jgi:hypothetical protein
LFKPAILGDVTFDIGVPGCRQFMPGDNIGQNVVGLAIAQKGRNE